MNIINKFILLVTVVISIILTSCVPNGGGTVPTTNCTDSVLLHSTKNNLVAYFCNFDLSYGSINDNNNKPIRGMVYGNINITTNKNGDSTALQFNGANEDFIAIVPTNFPVFDSTTAISIVLWYQPEYNPMSDYKLLFGKDTIVRIPDTHGQWSLGLYDLDAPVFGYNRNSLWDNTWRSSTNKYNQWHNLIAIYDPSLIGGNRWKLYRNGILTQSSYVCNCGSAIQQNSSYYYIGKNFKGKMDDIKIYNIAINEKDIPFFARYVSPKKCN